MNDVINLDFCNHTVRTVTLEGEPWFVAADVCRMLGFRIAKGTHRYLGNLEDDEKRLVTRHDCREIFTGNRASSQNLISEPGLYKLIGRSSKPEAREFDRWVRHEVLPQIRKTGSYQVDSAAVPETPKTYIEALEAHIKSEKEKAQIEAPKTYPEALRALADAAEEKGQIEVKKVSVE